MGRGRVSDATDSPVPSLVPAWEQGSMKGKEARREEGEEEGRKREKDRMILVTR